MSGPRLGPDVKTSREILTCAISAALELHRRREERSQKSKVLTSRRRIDS